MRRGLRKLALVLLMLFAVVVSPVALPIRMLIARRQRPTQLTEQVVHAERSNVRTLPSTL